MNDLSFRDWIWILLLGGGSSWMLGRYIVRSLRRGRCSGCDDTSCATRATGQTPEGGCQPLNLTLGEGRGGERPAGEAGGETGRQERRRTPSARRFHTTVAAIAFPFLFLLLASGIGLLFHEEMGLDHRPLPASLALPLYGGGAGRVVATTRGEGGAVVAAEDGVILRAPGGRWHGVAATAPLGAVHDVAWLGDGHLAAATDRGIWISADGRQWDYLADGSAGLPQPAMGLGVSGGVVWAQTALGPRRSEDGGVSWHPATGGLPAALEGAPAVAPALAGPLAGAARAWLTARGWPTWERLAIDLHGGHLFGGRWRAVVLFSWVVLLGLAVSGPLVARARRRHQRERAARARARVATTVAAPSLPARRPGMELARTAGNEAP